MVKWIRRLKWIGLGILLLLIVALVGGYIFLRSSGFRHYAMAKIIQEADASTGGRLTIHSFDFQWKTLTAHLYGLTLRGAEPPNAKPLLQVDKLTVGLKIESVLHRKLRFSELLVEHPVVHLQIDKNGKTNLPQPPPQKTQSSGPSVFDLAVGHAQISNGEIYCNDVKNRLDADLSGLQADARYSFLKLGYDGSLSYDRGVLQYAHYQPYAHSLNLKFTASPSSFSVHRLNFRIASSNLSLQAKIKNFDQPTADGTYEITIHPQDFAQLSPGVSAAGDITLSGKIGYQRAPGGSVLRGVSVDGVLNSGGLSTASSSANLKIDSLHGRYQLVHGVFQSRGIVARLLNGKVTANVMVDHLEAAPQAKIEAVVQGISLDAARRALGQPRLRRIPFAGTVDGGLQAAWSGSPRNLRLTSHAEVHGETWASSKASQQIPVEGTLHVGYDGARRLITISQTTFRAATVTLALQGEISDHSDLQINASARDLSQAASLATIGGTARSAGLAEISGSATLNAEVRGSMQKPQISGQLNAQNLRTLGSRWKTASLAFAANPSRASVQRASLVNADQGNVAFSGEVGLQRWSYSPSSPIAANLAIHRMAVADLQHLAGLQYPVTGNLNAELTVNGSQLNPSGRGTVQLTKATAYEEPVQDLTLAFKASAGTLHSTLSATLPAGKANADLRYTPTTKSYAFHLDAPSIVLEKLHAVESRNAEVAGTVKVSASGQGTLENPNLTAELRVAKLEVRQAAITGIKAQVNVANHKATLAFASDVAQAHVEGGGTINLTGGYYADLTFNAPPMPLQPLLAIYFPALPEDFQGETELHASAKGPLEDKSQIEAHLTIPRLTAAYQRLQVESAGPIRADYEHSLLTLQPVEIRGTDTSLRLQGTVPTAGTAGMNVQAKGSLNVRLIQIFRPEIKSAGSVAIEVRAAGSLHAPAVEGQIRLKDVALSSAAAPLGLEKLEGELELTNDRLEVKSLSGQLGGGQLSAGGSITLRPELHFDLAMQGNSIRLRYPEGVRTVLDTNLAFTGTAAASALTGRVLISSLSFTPDFDLSQFMGQFSGTSASTTPGAFANNLKLQVAVQSSQNLSASSSQLNLTGTADLRLIGTAAEPVIIGRADLTSGELFFRSNRYELQRGLVTFGNPTETEPILNVSVTTTIQQYNLTINLRGPMDRLQTSYVSDPPLATADVINLIARGQTTEQAGASTVSPDSILAGQVAGQFTGGIQKLAGISSLQIDPLIGGNNQDPSARVALQQRVTKNLLFTFSTDVTQPGSEVIQGDYRINRRWSVSVARDQQGGISIDGRYHTKF